MKNRIRDLARQSRIDVYGLGKDREKWELTLFKFAELIVNDCVDQCRQQWYETNNDTTFDTETDPRMIGIKIGIKHGSLKCISKIKSHFGVDE